MLYLSLYVPEGGCRFDRDILNDPNIARYAVDWGRDGDTGLVADAMDGQALGAVWLRLFSEEEKGFGYVDRSTPELGIAVLPDHRGKGIGMHLLTQLIENIIDDYPRISLSVSRDNPAVRLYRRLGFEIVDQTETAVTMVKRITTDKTDR